MGWTAYCSIPPWILSVPPHSRPDSQDPLVSPSLLVPCLTCGHPSRAVFSRLTSSQVRAPSPADAARHSVPITDSRVPAPPSPFRTLHAFSLPGKHLPPLQALGKCHFSLSGIISQPLGSSFRSSSHAVLDGVCRWSSHLGSQWGRGVLSGEGAACVCSSC